MCKLDIPGGCAIVDVLNDSQLVVVVGTGNHPTSSRRHVQILNMKKKQEISRLAFETPVLSIRMNTQRMAVVLEGEIHLFDMQRLSLCTRIVTSPNPNGLVALSNDTKERMLLAYPTSRGTLQADVVLYDPISLQQIQEISHLHDHPLTCMEFSPDGKWLATASAQGTRIQVIPVSDPKTRYTFRRGSYSADISSVTFSQDASFLAVSSTRETVHIFSRTQGEVPQTSSWLPVLNEPRSFAEIKLAVSTNKVKKLVGFDQGNSSLIYTITQDGKFSKWLLGSDTDKSRMRVCKSVQEESLLKDYYN